MRSWGKRSLVGLMAAAASLVLMAGALPAGAQAASKSKKSEGRLVSYDGAAGKMTVKVKGKDEVFHVKAEGSVLTRTTVTINAKPAKLDDLPPGAPVIVYWKDNPTDKGRKDARKIDAPSVPEDLLEEFGS